VTEQPLLQEPQRMPVPEQCQYLHTAVTIQINFIIYSMATRAACTAVAST